VPAHPRPEPFYGSARLSVDPVAGETVDRYLFECSGGSGAKVQGDGPEPNDDVGGLANGQAFTCVAYAENRVGRSAASVASASFTPCGGLLDCNPWLPPVLAGAAIAALLLGLLLAIRRSVSRSRMWITVQVDGGANQSLGWGQEHGVGLERGPEGWFARRRPIGSAPIRIRYDGKNRFVVDSAAGIRSVHQGDPALVREGTEETHQLIVRLYRQPPRVATAKPTPRDEKGGGLLETRIDRGTAEDVPEDFTYIGEGAAEEKRPDA
jgi:hypothetical protein